MAEPLTFCAICEAVFKLRRPATKPASSYPLSPPRMIRFLPGISQPSLTLRRPGRRSDARIHCKTVSVLRQDMPMKYSLASLPWPLLYSRDSGSLTETWQALRRFFPWKSTSVRITATPGRRLIVPGTKALQRCPRFNQGAAHSGMIIGQHRHSPAWARMERGKSTAMPLWSRRSRFLEYTG